MQVQKFGQNFSGTLSASDTNFVIYKSLYIGTEIFYSDVATVEPLYNGHFGTSHFWVIFAVI